MKSVQFRRSLTIILAVLFAIIMLYLWYTQFYINSREKQLTETHYRVLDQVSDNLKSKINSYLINARNLRQAVDDNQRAADDITSKINHFESLTENKEQKNQALQDSLDHYQKELTMNVDFRKGLLRVSNPDFKSIHKNEAASNLSRDSLYVTKDSLVISVGAYTFNIPLDLLLNNIDRKDIFEKSIILDTSKVVFSNFSRDLRLDLSNSANAGNYRRGGFLGISGENRVDTLFLPGGKANKAATIHSSRSYNVIISDGNYKLFLKPVQIENLNWFIGGLVDKKDFERSVRSIAPGFIIILSIVLLLVMVSLPFVKLKVMSKNEMLGTGTVVYAGLAFFLGASFLILFLFFKAYNLSTLKETDENLVGLSRSISSSLQDELTTAYRQLDETDSLFYTLSGMQDLAKKNNYITEVLNPNSVWKPTYYKYFDYIFWLDSTGQAIAQISPFTVQDKLSKYSDREYFKKKDEWFWPYSKNEKNKRFRMESIVSTTSGEFKAALSRPSMDAKHVIVMTGRFYSLIDPILPSGYKFCIIDENGKVWFHSNKYQNLGENFLSECNDDGQLAAALFANVSKSMNVSYFNNDHRIYFTRLNGLPLYLVTMHDLQMEYSYQAQVFITTVVMISFLFLYMLMLLIIILLLKHLFYKDLIATKFELDIINFRRSKREDYLQLIVMFIAALIIYCALMPWIPNMLAILIIYNIVAVLFVILFTHLYDFTVKTDVIKIFKWTSAGIMVGLYLILNYLSGNLTGSDHQLFYYSLIPLFLSLFFIFRYHKNNRLYLLVKKWPFAANIIHRLKKPEIAYSCVIFLMIILLGVAPILKFFDISADLENDIHTRFGQYELSADKEKRNLSYSIYYERINDCVQNKYCNDAYAKRKNDGIFTGFWNNTRWDRLENSGDTTKYTEDFEALVNAFRPIYQDRFSVYSKYLLYDTIENRPFKWINSSKGLVLVYSSLTEINGSKEPAWLTITSDVPRANIFKPIWTPGKANHVPEVNHFGFLKIALVYAILMLLLYLLFRLVLFTTRSAFGASLIEDYSISNFNGRIEDHMNENMPVIAINPSIFLGFKELAEKVSGRFGTTDFNWDDDQKNDLTKPLLVKDFFKEYQDCDILPGKIKKMRDCMLKTGKLIIMVEMNPDLVVSYYKEKVENPKKADPKADKENEDNVEKFRKTLDSLLDFLNRTIILFVPVHYDAADNEPAKIHRSLISEEENIPDARELISLDLSACDYLSTLKAPMEAYFNSISSQKMSPVKLKQVLINRISEMAGKYYRNILNNCTIEEKIVLMDLALDSIANVKNKESIIRLLRRGLITKGPDSIELMNGSFRAFLLAHYSKHDKDQIRQLIGLRSGSWAGYKYALWLVIIALFVFIFISNQEFLQNLNKMFLALGASIGGITTVLGIIGKKVREI